MLASVMPCDRVRRIDRIAIPALAGLPLLLVLATTPATAQFACTTTPSGITCVNPAGGNAPAFFSNTANGANQDAITTNAGTVNGFEAVTTAGGNATVTNSGPNTGDISAETDAGGSATATNSGNM